jgi:hypothetical protein
MADESGFKGKSLKAIAGDVADGYITVNPLFVKRFDKDMIKGLFDNINKMMTSIRNDKIVFSDAVALRTRNMKLQRLHSAQYVLRNLAREKRIPL